MGSIYFIADAHLDGSDTPRQRERQQCLLAFLDHIETRASRLYILGDLFDFWFEWRHVIPRYHFPVIYRLRQLVEAGIEIHLLSGNHDFALGSYLENEIGLRCHGDSITFELAGKRFFAAHGDGVARSDRGYRLLKRLIRHRLSRALFRTIVPPDLGMALARATSRSSRKLKRIDKVRWREEYADFARARFRERFDFVLLAHIHDPFRLEEGDRVYINCGDWMDFYSYAVFDGQTLTLKRWPDQSQSGE